MHASDLFIGNSFLFVSRRDKQFPELIPEKSLVYITTDAFSRRQYIG